MAKKKSPRRAGKAKPKAKSSNFLTKTGSDKASIAADARRGAKTSDVAFTVAKARSIVQAKEKRRKAGAAARAQKRDQAKQDAKIAAKKAKDAKNLITQGKKAIIERANKKKKNK